MYHCVKGRGECDGCGECRAPIGDVERFRCEDCGEVIDDGYYYDVDGVILCDYCMDKHYRKEVV